MMAWSALAGAPRIALCGPQDPVRVAGIVTYTGPLPDPIPITEAGTVRQLIEIEPKTKGLKDAVVWGEGKGTLLISTVCEGMEPRGHARKRLMQTP